MGGEIYVRRVWREIRRREVKAWRDKGVGQEGSRRVGE